VPPAAPVSSAISARIIHAALVLGVMLFLGIALYIGSNSPMPASALPDRRVLYVGLFLVSAGLFGAAMYTAARLTPPGPGVSQDEWWRANLSRAIGIWALVEAPAILGMVAYFLTHDFRTLIAPFVGLLLFVNYRPSRLAEE
jgi:putative copper export protein